MFVMFLKLSKYFEGLWGLGRLASQTLALKISKKAGNLEKHGSMWGKLAKV